MYRIKSAELFTIDDEGWLSATDTLVQNTYTLAVVAYDGDPIDAALIVVHVQDSSTSALAEHRTPLVAIGVVCGVLVLLLIVLITSLIVKYCR